MNFHITTSYSIGGKKNNDDSLMVWNNDKVPLILNEDKDIIIDDKETFAVAIADGVSGSKEGARASLLALDAVMKVKLDQEPQNILFEWAKQSNDIVNKNLNQKNSLIPNGATTLSGFVFLSSKIFGMNIGDTPCLYFRNHQLYELSKQHTLAQKKKDNNIEVFNQDYHTLVNYIGDVTSNGIESGYYFGALGSVGDAFIICSDGFSDYISKKRLIELLENREITADYLLKEVETKTKDNVSIILIRIEK